MGLEIIGVLLGAILAIFITIWIENLRKPKLKILIGEPVDQEYQNHPANNARFLIVKILNKALPKWAKCMTRNAAIHCQGTVTFHHLDGQNVFGRTIPTLVMESITVGLRCTVSFMDSMSSVNTPLLQIMMIQSM